MPQNYPMYFKKVQSIGKHLIEIDYDVLMFSYTMDAHGNSGGAIVNIDGELIGILTWQGQDDEDKKFAIPLTKIVEFLNSHQLI